MLALSGDLTGRKVLVNPAYRAYFRQRLEQMLEDDRAAGAVGRGGFAADSRAPLLARAAIDHARLQVPRNIEMRPDAELLVYLLASEFVAKPVLAMEPQNAIELADDLAEDAARVVDDAGRRVLDERRDYPDADGPHEVSAHQVVNALSENWSELRTGRLSIWDGAARRRDEFEGI